MTTVKELRRLRREAAARDVEKSRPYAYTGKVESGGVTASAGLAPGYIWVRIGAKDAYDPIPAIAAFNTMVANEAGLAVRLEKLGSGQWSIYSLDEPRAVSQQGSRVNAVAVPTRPGREVAEVVLQSNLLPGRVTRKRNGDGSQDGLYVSIEAFTAGGVDWATGSFELTPTATASMKAWAALYFLPSDGLIHQAGGSDHALTDTLTRDQIFSEVTFPEGAVCLWAFVLENGQPALTSTTQNEDIREFLNVHGGTSGGHEILVDDAAQTQRAGLNFISGDGIAFTPTDDAGNDETEIAAALDIASLTEDTTPDGTTSYAPVLTSGGVRKVLLDNLPAGSTSPLTTKGDLYIRSASADDRLPVGLDGQVPVADSSQTLGIRWASPGGLTGAVTITHGSYASLPPVGSNTGDLYVCTDAPYEFLWDGSAWKARAFGYEVEVPPSSGWSWVNQGTAAIDVSKGMHVLTAPAAGGLNGRQRVRTAPSTPYVITAAFIPGILLTTGAPSTFSGLIFRESSTGRSHIAAVVSPAGHGLYSSKFTNPTTFSAHYTLLAGAPIFPSLMWMRISDDGTNRKCSYSWDGFSFQDYHSVARTDFLTADEVGFELQPNTGVGSINMSLISWKVT